jgi:hypothetical protein
MWGIGLSAWFLFRLFCGGGQGARSRMAAGWGGRFRDKSDGLIGFEQKNQEGQEPVDRATATRRAHYIWCVVGVQATTGSVCKKIATDELGAFLQKKMPGMSRNAATSVNVW